MTSATAPVAAEIIAGRPPRNAIETAIVNEAKRPTRGSTPAMIEKEIASGISASATMSPPRNSMRNLRGLRRAAHVEVEVAVCACGGLIGRCDGDAETDNEAPMNSACKIGNAWGAVTARYSTDS